MRWRLNLKVGETLTPKGFGKFTSKVRIPVSGSILLTEEVREIIDLPQFQHLRGVRQLGPTIFVFPGANHTRFEHTLGVYSNTLKYLERLLSHPQLIRFLVPLEKTIKLTILTALFHDIGHYPYSHWIEELQGLKIKIPKHELRVKNIILSDDKLKRIISSKWEIEVNELIEMIKPNSKGNPLIVSIINSIIDVDKLDYLIRDSIHCGVNYGNGIDTDRLLESLTISPRHKKICVTEKGASVFGSILATRNIMYKEVYWHKTVRACEAMFKRFFYEFTRKTNYPQQYYSNTLFNLSDDKFIGQLYDWAINSKNENLKNLISPFAFQGRKLFKPAFIYQDTIGDDNIPKTTKDFFRNLTQDSPYQTIVRKSDQLAELLRIPALQLIIEKPPIKVDNEKYKLEEFVVYDSKTGKPLKFTKGINELNTVLEDSKLAYIFCHEKHYDRLRNMAINGSLHKYIAKLK